VSPAGKRRPEKLGRCGRTLDMVVYVTRTKEESLTQGREFAAVLMRMFDTSVHISNQINQSNKLFYSAPKSWPESWPT